MYEVKIVTQFAAAHRLENFNGKCESLHGHNWKVEVFLGGKDLDGAGLLMDFGVVKARTKEVLEEVDHKYLNELAAFQDRNPSSENLACYLYERLGAIFNGDRVKVRRVNVWESDNSCASYYQD
ncbi:MAG: 6-carboxytetrahydropterin synthase QueD [Syntrophales bacterium]|nr:6-carboxytetrahydropterin synthase QueD [Syntrophales bacterium]